MITERKSIRWNDALRLVDKLSINRSGVHITHMSIALLYTLILFTGKLTMYNQSELQVSLHMKQYINALLVVMGMKECIVRVPPIENIVI